MGRSLHYIGNGVLVFLVQCARGLPKRLANVLKLFGSPHFLLLGLSGHLLLGFFGEAAGLFLGFLSRFRCLGLSRLCRLFRPFAGRGASMVCVLAFWCRHNSFVLAVGQVTRGTRLWTKGSEIRLDISSLRPAPQEFYFPLLFKTQMHEKK